MAYVWQLNPSASAKNGLKAILVWISKRLRRQASLRLAPAGETLPRSVPADGVLESSAWRSASHPQHTNRAGQAGCLQGLTLWLWSLPLGRC